MQVVKSIIKLNKRNNESLNNVGIWYHLVDSEIIELWIVINEAEFPTIYRSNVLKNDSSFTGSSEKRYILQKITI